MKFTKSFIMKKAWWFARTAARIFGGKAKEYIAGSLKMSWEFARKASLEENHIRANRTMYDAWVDNCKVLVALDKESFNILGLTTLATIQQVKKAYRKLSITHHPDKGGCAEDFIKIRKAYEACLLKFKKI